ncbi:hypothetical protein [Roseateles chitosanitabidus]|nr:hypothetical protein [Roseateles chitosanitabidus]
MKRADIPANIFAGCFILAMAAAAVIVGPIVVLAWALDGFKAHRRESKR